jgi:hypothetical protein
VVRRFAGLYYCGFCQRNCAGHQDRHGAICFAFSFRKDMFLDL